MARRKITPDREVLVQNRRTLVAELWTRGLTQREIHAAVGTRIVNPDTNEAFTLATIHSDIKAIRKEWRDRRFEDVDQLISDELAQLNAVTREAWKQKDLPTIIKASHERRQLLGLDAPMRAKIESTNVAINLTPELMARIEALGLTSYDVTDEITNLLAGIEARVHSDK